MPQKFNKKAAEAEAQIQEAMNAVKTTSISISKAANNFNVPRSTLSQRLKGRQSRQEGRAHFQNLSPMEEEELL